MLQTTSRNTDNILIEYINQAVRSVVTEQYDKAIEEATQRAREKRDEAVASILLRLSRQMSIQTWEQEIRIIIDKSLLDEEKLQ